MTKDTTLPDIDKLDLDKDMERQLPAMQLAFKYLKEELSKDEDIDEEFLEPFEWYAQGWMAYHGIAKMQRESKIKNVEVK